MEDKVATKDAIFQPGIYIINVQFESFNKKIVHFEKEISNQKRFKCHFVIVTSNGKTTSYCSTNTFFQDIVDMILSTAARKAFL